MSASLLVIIAFCLALFIGIYLGKLLQASGNKSNQAAADEKIQGLQLQLSSTKDLTEKEQREKSSLQQEKESLMVQLSKKEADYDYLLLRLREQKQETEQLQEKFTKEFGDQLNADYAENPEGLEKLINAMKPYVPVTDRLKDDENGDKRFTGKTWSELDKAGLLPELKATDLELFKTMYKEEFNRDYTNN